MSYPVDDHHYTEEPTRNGIRAVDYDPLDYSGYIVNHLQRRVNRQRNAFLLMIGLFVCIVVGFSGTLAVREAFLVEDAVAYEVVPNEEYNKLTESTISPFFSPQVLYWRDDILRWAQEYNLDPNLIATVMQIESCGNPQAGSGAGAQGLFQVMPFHFTEGEEMQEKNTNAKRGLNYLVEGLRLSEGHIGSALAGYNGGHGMILWGTASWNDEVWRYHYWGTGIYYDTVAGEDTSERLQEWLNAGGQRLCDDAAVVQQTLASLNTNQG